MVYDSLFISGLDGGDHLCVAHLRHVCPGIMGPSVSF